MGILATAMAELARDRIQVTQAQVQGLTSYMGWIRAWNDVVSLVSQGDFAQLESRHLVDSLSLARHIREACAGGGGWLDIGSGGGFPAIPVKVVLPEVRVTLLERSERKVGFLLYAAGKLQLRDTEVVLGEFPRTAPEPATIAVVTARAVEKPDQVLRHVAAWMTPGMVFLCQSGEPKGLAPDMFHVEQVEDGWSAQSLRRGTLHRVCRR